MFFLLREEVPGREEKGLPEFIDQDKPEVIEGCCRGQYRYIEAKACVETARLTDVHRREEWEE